MNDHASSWQKIRLLCLCDEMQQNHPEWPYPFLFQGHEIPREIFFLDPLIEYRHIKLGGNLVYDGGSVEYRSLNEWFHYVFFNVMAPVGYSMETACLLPRLYRLKRVLLEKSGESQAKAFLEKGLAVSNPQQLLDSLVSMVTQLIQISSEHRLVVWGVRISDEAAREHAAYISNVLAKIPLDLVFNLPHVRRPLGSTELLVLEEEKKALKKIEASYNKRHNKPENSGESV
jgi:hypothetical protein